jgi:parallel beta helix pectate lyase-like protein/disaggregatase-related protein
MEIPIMRHAAIATVMLFGMLADVHTCVGQPFPSAGSPNPAMTAAPVTSTPAPSATPRPPATPTPSATPAPDVALPPGSAPRAVTVARATEIPACTLFVDAAANGRGTAQSPFKTIAAAVAAAGNGAAICVAEGTYAEQIKPGEKSFVLAGGFQRGKDFKVRDSAAYVTKATGRGGSFIRIEDPGPKGDQRTVIDGFDISGYSQAIVREYYESQRFDLTNNHIHDNKCASDDLAGAGFALNNVSGRIEGNVFRNNSCGRGGAGFLNDSTKANTVTIERNLIDGNAGTEPALSHGGALYLFGKTLRITGNLFTRNSVTQWGGGLYVGADLSSGPHTTANLNWNVYRDNRAGNGGGGMFCDDGATCLSYHEVYERNCGSNILLDSGAAPATTIARFGQLTNVGALDVDCKAPGAGVRIDNIGAADVYSFVDAIFWGNAPGLDFVATCDTGCGKIRVNVSYSMVQTQYRTQNVRISFGDGIVAPVDPLFADPEKGDFHLKSAAGRWTPTGYAKDSVSSPLLAKGYPEGSSKENPERAGKRNELGAYGNSGEASYVR